MTVPGHPPVVMNLAGFRAITRQVSFDFNTTSSCGDPKSGIVFPAWDEHDPMPLANGAPLVSEADARPPYQIIYSKNDRSPWIDAYNADPFIYGLLHLHGADLSPLLGTSDGGSVEHGQ